VDLLEGKADPEGKIPPPSLTKGTVPVVYTATTPTELIVTEGAPKFVAVTGTALEYAENTTGHVFKHTSENKLYAAHIPQTATVSRQDAKLNPPRFDGDPVFKSLEGTSLEYVINTATPIIRVDDKSFYAVENGVWFKAASLNGPWSVADSVPAAIYPRHPSLATRHLPLVTLSFTGLSGLPS